MTDKALGAFTEDTPVEESPVADGGLSPTPAMREEHEARMERIQDYLASALKKDHPLEANLGSVAAGLMRIGIHLDEAIEQLMTTAPMTFERLQKILPSLETYLRVTRQIDRLAHLEQQFTRSHRPREPANLPGIDRGPCGARED